MHSAGSVCFWLQKADFDRKVKMMRSKRTRNSRTGTTRKESKLKMKMVRVMMEATDGERRRRG